MTSDGNLSSPLGFSVEYVDRAPIEHTRYIFAVGDMATVLTESLLLTTVDLLAQARVLGLVCDRSFLYFTSITQRVGVDEKTTPATIKGSFRANIISPLVIYIYMNGTFLRMVAFIASSKNEESSNVFCSASGRRTAQVISG